MKFISYEKTLQELNIGGSLVTAALEEACGVSRSKITEMYNELGDLGTYILFLLFLYAVLDIFLSSSARVLGQGIAITSQSFFYV